MSTRLKMTYLIVAAAVVVVLFSLSKVQTPTVSEKRLSVVATTGMIADVARNVAGEHADVIGLMGPGVDPHLYKASQGDVRRLNEADIIFYNGLTLEGRMVDVLIRMARIKPTFAVTEYVSEEKLIASEDFGGHFDPHVWFDIPLWKITVERVKDALIEVDPEHQDDYEKNTTAFMEELDELHEYIQNRLAEIPLGKRVLVTAHDAFGYFGAAYDLEVVGLQGISTDTEVGLRDIQELVSFLVERGIHAVFVESSIPRRAIEAVVEGAQVQGHQVVIGGELFSDALGDAGTPEGTYIGMVRHNVDTIVSALK